MLLLGRYQTRELLGESLLGRTYAGRDLQGGVDVVVKDLVIKGLPDSGGREGKRTRSNLRARIMDEKKKRRGGQEGGEG